MKVIPVGPKDTIGRANLPHEYPIRSARPRQGIRTKYTCGAFLKAEFGPLGATRGAPSPSNFGNIYINGARTTDRAVFVDGVSFNDSGSTSYIQLDPLMDAVAEIQVINSSKEAEHGRNGASTLDIITRSGGRNFHGDVAYYFRNEDLNANNFFNNSTGQARPIYRYNIGDAAIGGPVIIPGLCNLPNWGSFAAVRDEVERIAI